MKYEDLPDNIKPLCWDGKEPITKFSDVEDIQIDPVSARAALLKHSVNGCVGVFSGWGLDNDGNPVVLDQ